MADPQDLFWLVRHGAPAHLYPWLLDFIEALGAPIWETPFFVLNLLRSAGGNDLSCNCRKHVKASMNGWLITF